MSLNKLSLQSSSISLHSFAILWFGPKSEMRPVGQEERVELGNTGLDESIKPSIKTDFHAHGPSQHGWRFTTQ